MIQLSSRHSMVIDRTGRQGSFDQERVLEDLTSCFRRCGIDDPWAAETIGQVVEEQVVGHRRETGSPPTEEALDDLVAAALAAAGYGDVAAKYRLLRGIDPLASMATGLAPWRTKRLERVLSAALPVPAEQVAELAAKMEKAFRELAFTRVSDELIVQIGIHLLHSEPRTPADPCHRDSGHWLFPPGSWHEHIAQPARVLCEEDVVQPWPVSNALPRIGLSIDLARSAQHIADLPLTELVLLPGLRDTCRIVRDLMRTMRHRVCLRRRHAAHHPARILLTNTGDALLECLVPMCPRDAKRLRDDIREIVRSEILQPLDFDVFLTER